MSTDPQNWSISQTLSLLKKRDNKINADALMTLGEQEIDMLVLFQTTKEELMNVNIKLGPATRILKIAKELKEGERQP